MIGDKTVIEKQRDCEYIDVLRPRWFCPYSATVEVNGRLLCRGHADLHEKLPLRVQVK